MRSERTLEEKAMNEEKRLLFGMDDSDFTRQALIKTCLVN